MGTVSDSQRSPGRPEWLEWSPGEASPDLMGPLGLEGPTGYSGGDRKPRTSEKSSKNGGVGSSITGEHLGLRTSYDPYEPGRWRRWVEAYTTCGSAPAGSEINSKTTSQMLSGSVMVWVPNIHCPR